MESITQTIAKQCTGNVTDLYPLWIRVGVPCALPPVCGSPGHEVCTTWRMCPEELRECANGRGLVTTSLKTESCERILSTNLGATHDCSRPTPQRNDWPSFLFKITRAI